MLLLKLLEKENMLLIITLLRYWLYKHAGAILVYTPGNFEKFLEIFNAD